MADTNQKKSHLSRNIGIAVALIIILVISIVAGIYFAERSGYISSSSLPFIPAPTPIPTALLQVSGQVISGQWIRNPSTDLPAYQSTINYNAYNAGNAPATDVSISIAIDGAPYSNQVIPSISTGNSYSNSFTISEHYWVTDTLTINASCSDSTNSYSMTIGSVFPTNWGIDTNTNQIICQDQPSLPSSTVELFVTPNEQTVVSMKNSILQSKSILDPDWTAIWEWVGSNIKYNTAEYNAEENGGPANWQFPLETLQSKTGICIDYSILLCSLYRDGVFGPNDCYVVLGTNAQGDWHAWDIVRFYVLGQSVWYTLDPQENGNFLVNLIVNPFDVSGYTGHFEFNDQQFITLNS